LLGFETAEKKNFTLKPFNARARQHIGSPVFGQKSPAAKARELLKPFTDSASLLVDIEKNIYRFGFEVFWGERHN